MTYVDGYVLPVPKKNKAKYKKMAKEAAKVWKKCGALQYIECWGDDLNPDLKGEKFTKFPKMVKAKRTENVVFAFIVYKNKTHRNKVNKAVMKQMTKDMEKYKDVQMPFEVKRMAYGGFKSIVKE